MIVSSFPGNSLLHQSGGFEPLRKSNFAVAFYGLPDTDLLTLSIRKVSPNAAKITKNKVKYFNESINYAGSVTQFDSVTLTFLEYMDRSTTLSLWNWFTQVWCPDTGAIGLASSYKKRGDIFALPPGMGGGDCPGAVSSTDSSVKWHLEGCFPTSLKFDEFSHEDEGTPVMVNLEISVDRAYPVK